MLNDAFAKNREQQISSKTLAGRAGSGLKSSSNMPTRRSSVSHPLRCVKQATIKMIKHSWCSIGKSVFNDFPVISCIARLVRVHRESLKREDIKQQLPCINRNIVNRFRNKCWWVLNKLSFVFVWGWRLLMVSLFCVNFSVFCSTPRVSKAHFHNRFRWERLWFLDRAR